MVKKVHPGVDGLVRTVELQTIKGTCSSQACASTDQDFSSDANNCLLPPRRMGNAHIGLPPRIPPHQENSRWGQTSHMH